jgi:hypothetical protein
MAKVSLTIPIVLDPCLAVTHRVLFLLKIIPRIKENRKKE